MRWFHPTEWGHLGSTSYESFAHKYHNLKLSPEARRLFEFWLSEYGNPAFNSGESNPFYGV